MAIFLKTGLLRRLTIITAIVVGAGYLLKDEAVDFWQDEVQDYEKLQDGDFTLELQARNLVAKKTVGVLLFGDAGLGNETQHEVAAGMWDFCRKAPCALGIGLGDNIYPDGVMSVDDPQWQTKFESPYREFINAAEFNFWMAVGNHDRRGSVSAQINYSQHSPLWRMPARDFAIPQLPPWLNIYVLDSTFVAPGADIPPYQSAFDKHFRKQLERASAHLCDKDGWRVLVTHHPVVSTGARNNRFREDNMHDALQPFIESCGVHLVFSGHEHLQQHLEMDGVEYLVQGAASSVRQRVKPLEHSSAISRYLGYEPGFAHLLFSKDELKIRFNDSRGKILYRTNVELENYGKRQKMAADRFD